MIVYENPCPYCKRDINDSGAAVIFRKLKDGNNPNENCFVCGSKSDLFDIQIEKIENISVIGGVLCRECASSAFNLLIE